jgi:hypothetical protein
MVRSSVKVLLQFYLALFIMAGSAAAGYDWKYWSDAPGYKFALTEITSSWTDCEGEAAATGGHLVTINSGLKDAWLDSAFGTDTKYWIGLYQPPGSPEPAGGWVWISREPVTFLNWYTVEPNNSNGHEDYAVKNIPTVPTNQWGDDSNEGVFGPHRGMIEAPVPLPATLILLGSGLLGLAGWRRLTKS